MTDRTKLIEARQFKIHRGAAAEAALTHLGNTFAEVKEIILNDLYHNTKQTGEIDNYSVHSYIALRDMVQRLREHISAGDKAARAVDKEMRNREVETNA